MVPNQQIDRKSDKPVKEGNDAEPKVTQPQLVTKKRTQTREVQPPAHFRDRLGKADN